MRKKNSATRGKGGKIAAASIVLAAALVAPTLGSAATDSSFGVKAINTEQPEFNQTRGLEGAAVEAPDPEPSGPAEGSSPSAPYIGALAPDFTASPATQTWSRAYNNNITLLIYGNSAVTDMEKALKDAGIEGVDKTSKGSAGVLTSYTITDPRNTYGNSPITSLMETGWGFGLYSGEERIEADIFSSMQINIYKSDSHQSLTIGITHAYWDSSYPRVASDQNRITAELNSKWIPSKKLFVTHGGRDYYFDASTTKAN